MYEISRTNAGAVPAHPPAARSVADNLLGMSQAPPDAEDHDADLGPAVPEPPRRVPFGVTVTAALLGLVSVLLLLGATVALTTNSYYDDSIGEAAAEGLATAAIAVSAALVAAVAWSFVRNGNTVGPLVVGVLLLLSGLIGLAAGVISEGGTDGLRVGVVALVLGLGVILVPLLGHAPSYLAARRVWSKAERDWLHDLATPEAPPRMPYQPQWGQPALPQPPWGAPPQQPAYPQQYQYPPQPGQPPTGQPWPGPQPQLQQPHEAWHQAAVPGSAWTGQQPPAQASAPPAPAPPIQPPAGRPSATPLVAPQQAEPPPFPYAAAQQAPTEHIRTQGALTPPTPQGEPPPPQQPS
jgi:hypothetical protein